MKKNLTIGEGSFAKIYSLNNDGEKCIKKLLKEHIQNEESMKNFELDYDTLKKLNSVDENSFPRVYSFDPNSHSFTIEKFDMDLETFFNERVNQSDDDLKHFLSQKIINIFLIIEEQNICDKLTHNDIKPNNFLIKIIEKEKKIVLTDFGMSHYDEFEKKDENYYEKKGDSKYIKTEVYHGKEMPSKNSEIYSVLRVINFIYTNNPFENFNDDLWFDFESGRIGSFKELQKLFELYVDKNEVKTPNDELFVRYKKMEVLEVIAELHFKYSIFQEAAEIISDDLGGEAKQFMDLIFLNYKKLNLKYVVLHDLAKLFFRSVLSVNFSNEDKINYVKEIIYIRNYANSFIAFDQIEMLKNNEKIRKNIDSELIVEIDKLFLNI